MNRDSRRARLILALLLLTSFTLLTIDYRSNGSSPLHPLEQAVAGVVGPGQRALTSVVRPITERVHLGKQDGELRRLRAENTDLRNQVALSQDDRRKARQFDKLMRYADYFRVKPARVVGFGDSVGFDRTVVVDMGSADGVRVDMTVVSGDGLLGKVVQVDRATSTVALIDDTGIKVSARSATSGYLGWVQGRADGRLDFTPIQQNAAMKVGEYVLTLGLASGGVYPANIPIGKVVSVRPAPGSWSASAIVEPVADLVATDVVGIIFGTPKRPERGDLLPAKPSPTPSPTTCGPIGPGISSGWPVGSTSPSPGGSSTPSSSRSPSPAHSPSPSAHSPSASAPSAHSASPSPSTHSPSPTPTGTPTGKPTGKPTGTRSGTPTGGGR